MKHLNRFLIASLLIMIVGSVNAQDETNPWSISVGANIVDFFPTGADEDLPAAAGERGDLFEEFYNARDHWNAIPTLSYVNVSRYVGKGFVVGASATINEIDQFGDRETATDLEYVGLDGEISYGFKKLLKSKWFDPYAQIGGGYTWLENEVTGGNRGFGTVNGGLGIRFWFNENINLGVKSIYKQDFDDDQDTSLNITREHFQHVFGLGVAFGKKDTDRDGISDRDDACPTIAGIAEFNGCPDSDADGIEDSKDACPTVAGLAEFNGCPDSDGDGIPDDRDACPTVSGINALSGCPDSDGDGVKDSNDNCPTIAGPRANSGCPYVDTDGDGILDKYDDNPTVAGAVSQDKFSNSGPTTPINPQISVGVTNDLDVQFKRVLFYYNKTTMLPNSYETLDVVANIMNQYSNASLLIEGHTDSKGREDYNLTLSNKRVAAVKKYLQGKGISSSRLQAKGYGEAKPIATNKTATGRQENRRVELSIITQ